MSYPDKVVVLGLAGLVILGLIISLALLNTGGA
jgi:hypothetical protein